MYPLHPYLLASLRWGLWGLLAISVVLTFTALPSGSWRMALLGGACSLVLAVAAPPTIGVFMLLLAASQLLLAYALYRRRRRLRTSDAHSWPGPA